jgi:hypothetical protein
MAEPSGPAANGDPAPARRGRRTLLLIALVALAPIVASYAAYYFFRPDARSNYGTLLPTQPAAEIEGTTARGAPFRLAELRGRWALIVAGDGRCDAPCNAMLYATRQARTMQNREQERIVRVLVVSTDTPPDAAIVDANPGLIVVHRAPASASASTPEPMSVLLVDPLGNQVLRYREPLNVKGLARDLARLLKASRIG